MNTVKSSPTLQSFYRRLNFAKVTYQSNDARLEQHFNDVTEAFRTIVTQRDKLQVS